jgi:hypothetical protein
MLMRPTVHGPLEARAEREVRRAGARVGEEKVRAVQETDPADREADPVGREADQAGREVDPADRGVVRDHQRAEADPDSAPEALRTRQKATRMTRGLSPQADVSDKTSNGLGVAALLLLVRSD